MEEKRPILYVVILHRRVSESFLSRTPRKRDIIGLARVTRNGTRVNAVDIADESRPGKESTLEKVPRSETRAKSTYL